MKPLLVTLHQPHGLVPDCGLAAGRSPIDEPFKLELKGGHRQFHSGQTPV
jgi:hypothetical protein